MIELHYFPGNASMIPHILLEELGEKFTLRLVDRANAAHKAPAYLKLNPNGLIPVFVEGDLVLYETAAICLHLADTRAAAGLVPPLIPPVGSAERAHCYKWLAWLTNTLQATSMLYWYPERWVAEGNTAAAAEIKASAETKIGTMLDQLDALLAAHGKPWLLGDQYSVVDPYALVLCRWTRGFARPARSLPHLGPYLQRMLARPAVQRVYATENPPPPAV